MSENGAPPGAVTWRDGRTALLTPVLQSSSTSPLPSPPCSTPAGGLSTPADSATSSLPPGSGIPSPNPGPETYSTANDPRAPSPPPVWVAGSHSRNASP